MTSSFDFSAASVAELARVAGGALTKDVKAIDFSMRFAQEET